jgi:transposase
VRDERVEALYADADYRGDTVVAASCHGIQLVVVTRPEASKGFVLPPKRWVVERSFAWLRHFCRLTHDHERIPQTLVGLHFAAFMCFLLPKPLSLIGGS